MEHLACAHSNVSYIASHVDIILDTEQVIDHRLVSELMKERSNHIKPSVQNNELGFGFFRSLQARYILPIQHST